MRFISCSWCPVIQTCNINFNHLELYNHRTRPTSQEAQQNQQHLENINRILQRFNQMAQAQGQGQCTLFAAVQEIMNSFSGG